MGHVIDTIGVGEARAVGLGVRVVATGTMVAVGFRVGAVVAAVATADGICIRVTVGVGRAAVADGRAVAGTSDVSVGREVSSLEIATTEIGVCVKSGVPSDNVLVSRGHWVRASTVMAATINRLMLNICQIESGRSGFLLTQVLPYIQNQKRSKAQPHGWC